MQADVCPASTNGLSICIEGRSKHVWFATEGEKVYLQCDGHSFLFSLKKEESAFNRGDSGGGVSKSCIAAPMPGCVLKVFKKDGDGVEEGECLAILEAMKMETELFAPMTGIVKQVYVRHGDQVVAGQPIIELRIP